MKKLLIVPAVALLSVASIPAVHAADIAQSICEYVQADDKGRLRSYLKSNKIKIRNVFDGVQCNGQNLLAFASEKNSLVTGTLMINKLPRKKVQGVLASIQSPELTAAAQKRING
ncbi:DUF3718 domain-containing protein [Thalassomonas sp. RHCl1]|uniref:DUF3718 domain-containing protein n=1 Tax=Thalassomonas sp. RHCl1 TaxID=2995320 RepID=UPI00248A9D09|nr:DUF3718 domain-containing protein [Thalassomonas sp. RHCl1]